MTYTCHAFEPWKNGRYGGPAKRCLSALNADIGNAIETGFLRGKKTDAAKKNVVENAQPDDVFTKGNIAHSKHRVAQVQDEFMDSRNYFLKSLRLKQETQRMRMQAATERIAKR